MYGSSYMFRHYIAIIRERSYCLLRDAQLRSSRYNIMDGRVVSSDVVRMPLCPPRISHKITLHWTQEFALRYSSYVRLSSNFTYKTCPSWICHFSCAQTIKHLYFENLLYFVVIWYSVRNQNVNEKNGRARSVIIIIIIIIIAVYNTSKHCLKGEICHIPH
jgi:hypothetical protein